MNTVDTARPASVDELAAILRDSDAGTVDVRGAGTKSTWGGNVAPADLVVDTSALSGVVEHARGDLIVTVGAGARLADLQAELADSRQWLPLDPPEADATVGGVAATATAGPRRLRFGTPRDLLIGISVVLADGTLARSGGKVVKNVAGYDLGRLFTGSFGTLGVIATCTFRLHPVAPDRRVVSVAVDDPSRCAAALARIGATPSAVEWDGSRLHVLVESSPAGAEAQAREVAGVLGTTDIDAELPTGFGARPWRPGEVGVKVTHALSGLAPVLAAVRRELPGARLSAHVGSGVLWAGLAADTGALPRALARLRSEVSAYGGSVVVADAPAAVKAGVDVWGPVPGLELMRRIKERFDPSGRMRPGGFVGGI